MKDKVKQEKVVAYAVDYIKGRNSGLLLDEMFNKLYDSISAVKYKDAERTIAHRRLLAQSIVIDCIMPLSKVQLERLEAKLLLIAETID